MVVVCQSKYVNRMSVSFFHSSVNVVLSIMYSLVKCEFVSLSFVNCKSVYFSPVSLYKVCCQSGKHFQHRQQGLVCQLSVEIFPKNKWLDYAHKMDRKKTTKKGFLIYDITPWTSLESCGQVNCPLHSEFTADMDFKWGASKPRVADLNV